MVRVRVLTAFTYQGRMLQEGDIVEMLAHQAALAKSQGWVIQTTAVQPEAPTEPEPSPSSMPRVKRRYRRRDLTADAP